MDEEVFAKFKDVVQAADVMSIFHTHAICSLAELLGCDLRAFGEIIRSLDDFGANEMERKVYAAKKDEMLSCLDYRLHRE